MSRARVEEEFERRRVKTRGNAVTFLADANGTHCRGHISAGRDNEASAIPYNKGT
jgi:hypothetical protein